MSQSQYDPFTGLNIDYHAGRHEVITHSEGYRTFVENKWSGYGGTYDKHFWDYLTRDDERAAFTILLASMKRDADRLEREARLSARLARAELADAHIARVHSLRLAFETALGRAQEERRAARKCLAMARNIRNQIRFTEDRLAAL
jgi:hypothetical protein